MGNRRKRFYGETWGNTVRGGGTCENPVRLSMYGGHMETVEYMWVNIWRTLDFVTKLQKYTSFAYSCSTSECTKRDAVMAGGNEVCENLNPLDGLTFYGTT